MESYRYISSLIDPHGSPSSLVEPYEALWSPSLPGPYTMPYGALWTPEKPYGALWSFIEPHVWSLMEFHGALWRLVHSTFMDLTINFLLLVQSCPRQALRKRLQELRSCFLGLHDAAETDVGNIISQGGMGPLKGIVGIGGEGKSP